MNAPARVALGDITWPAPVISNPLAALEATGCLIERLIALHDLNTADMQEALIDGRGMADWQQTRAYQIWMVYTLAGEKLAEIDKLVSAIVETQLAERRTSIGHHVDIRRRSDYYAALAAFNAAEAVPVTVDTPDEVLVAASDTLLAFVNTRSPDLRCLSEKLDLIRAQGVIHADGVIAAIHSDVDYLARRYEIDGTSAAQAEG